MNDVTGLAVALTATARTRAQQLARDLQAAQRRLNAAGSTLSAARQAYARAADSTASCTPRPPRCGPPTSSRQPAQRPRQPRQPPAGRPRSEFESGRPEALSRDGIGPLCPVDNRLAGKIYGRGRRPMAVPAAAGSPPAYSSPVPPEGPHVPRPGPRPPWRARVSQAQRQLTEPAAVRVLDRGGRSEVEYRCLIHATITVRPAAADARSVPRGPPRSGPACRSRRRQPGFRRRHGCLRWSSAG